MLGDGQSSYLSKTYVLSRYPQVSSIYAANYTLMESGVFFIGGQLLPKKSLKTIQSSLYKNIRSICGTKLDQRSLEKVKNQYLVNFFDDLDTNNGIASFLGNRQAYYGDYAFYNKEMEIYNKITLDQVRHVCEKYITKENSIFLSIWEKHPKRKGTN
jgi:zinc protease